MIRVTTRIHLNNLVIFSITAAITLLPLVRLCLFLTFMCYFLLNDCTFPSAFLQPHTATGVELPDPVASWKRSCSCSVAPAPSFSCRSRASPADLPAGGHAHTCPAWIPSTWAQPRGVSRAALAPRPPQLLAHNSSCAHFCCTHLRFPPKTSPSPCWGVGIHPPRSTRTEGGLDPSSLIFHILSSVATL